jgi:hypothetical protein
MKGEYGLLFWVHVLLIILSYTSFLYVDWKLILVVTILLQLQYSFIGGCIVTHLQMGKDSNETFIWYYLKKLIKDLDPKKTKFIIRIIVPIIILLLAIILQVVYGLVPYIKL